MKALYVPMTDMYLIFQFVTGCCHGNQLLCRSGLVHSEPKYLRIRWTNFHNLYIIW